MRNLGPNRTLGPKVVRAALDRMDAAYWEDVDRLASRIRAEYVVPFCRRKGWDFCGGMGSWSFYRPDNKQGTFTGHVVAPEDLPKRLVAMLDAETLHNGQSIGSLIARDVRAEENFK